MNAEQKSKATKNGAKKAMRREKALETKEEAKKKRIEEKLRKYITRKYGKIK